MLASDYSIAVDLSLVPEGAAGGSTTLTYTITRTDTTAAGTIDYTLGGTATAGSDYDNVQLNSAAAPPAGTISFAVGEDTAVITLDVLGDADVELDETISITLANPDAGAGTISGANPAVATIENDDFNLKRDLAGNLVFTDVNAGGRHDDLRISFDAPAARFVLTDPANTLAANPADFPTAVLISEHTIEIPLAAVPGPSILVHTQAGNDTLTLDTTEPLPRDVHYDGGSQTTIDQLVIQGGAGPVATVNHIVENATSGQVAVAGSGTVSYTGLEPVIDNLNAANRSFTFVGGAETITLTDAPAAGFMTIDSTLGESITFPNPTVSLTIDTVTGAAAGANLVAIDSVDAAFAAATTVVAAAGDAVDLNVALSLNGALSVTAGAIELGADISTNNAHITLAGAVTLTADVALASGTGNVTFTQTLSGPFDLEVNSDGITTFGGAVSIASLTTDANGETRLNGGSITTTGAQLYEDDMLLGANTLITAGGDVTFAQTVNGAFALSVDSSGTTTFGGSVGNNTPLTSLATALGGTTAIEAPRIETSGNQTYGDPVVIGAAAVDIVSSGGSITFQQNITDAVTTALAISAGLDVSLADATLDGPLPANPADDSSLTILFDTGADDGARQMTAGALLAGSISITGGTPANDTAAISGAAVATLTDVAIQDAASITLAAGASAQRDVLLDATTITAGGDLAALTRDVVVTGDTLNLAANVDVRAQRHVAIAAQVALTGNSGTNTIEAVTGNVTLGPVADTGASIVALEIHAGGSATLETITLDGGPGTANDPLLLIRIDSDANQAGQTLTAGALIAGQIDVRGGSDGDDLLTFNSPVGATRSPAAAPHNGDVLVQDAATADFRGNVSAARNVSVAADSVLLAGGVSVTAGAEVSLATQIQLTGTSGVNAITATAGNVTLGPVTDTAAAIEELQISAGQSATLATITLDGNPADDTDDPLLSIQVDAGPTSGVQTLTAGTLIAGRISALGATDGNEIFTFNGQLHARRNDATIGQQGDVLVQRAAAVHFNDIVDARHDVLVALVGTANANADISAGNDVSISAGTVNLAANVDVAAGGNASLGSLVRLTGAAGINSIAAATGDVTLGPVSDTGGPVAELRITAARHVALATVLLDDGAAPWLTIRVDNAADAIDGNLTAASIQAGRVDIRSNSSETIDFPITASREIGGESIVVELAENAALASHLLVTGGVTIQTTGDGRNIRLLAGDNIAMAEGTSVLALGVLQIFGDHNTADSEGTRIDITGTSGPIGAAGGVHIRGEADDDFILLSPDRLRAGDTFQVDLLAGADRIKLPYSANWSGPASLTTLTISGSADSQLDVLDLDQTADTLPRKRQFTYVNADGSDVDLLTEGGGPIDHQDFLDIRLRSMDAYVVRGGTSLFDQTIIIGLPNQPSFITVGNIDMLGNVNPDDDQPDAFRDCYPGRLSGAAPALNRFGVSGAELLRTIGGTAADDIRIDIDPGALGPPTLLPSGVKVNLIEGNGGTAVVGGTGELLQGSLTVRNIVFGAGPGNPLHGTPWPGAGSEPVTGQSPTRALLTGGAAAINLNPGDFLLANFRRDVDPVTGVAGPAVEVPGGSLIDVLYGPNYIIGQHDRMKQNPKVQQASGGSLSCFTGESYWIGTEIDVCAWLKARFPGSGPGSPLSGGVIGNPKSPEFYLQQFNHRLLVLGPAPLPPAEPEAPALDPLDVNADGLVTPLDALLVINHLNRAGEGEASPSPSRLDVSGDGYVTPLDALLVINRLNQPIAVAEGETSGEVSAAAADAYFEDAATAAGYDPYADLWAIVLSDLAFPRKKRL